MVKTLDKNKKPANSQLIVFYTEVLVLSLLLNIEIRYVLFLFLYIYLITLFLTHSVFLSFFLSILD